MSEWQPVVIINAHGAISEITSARMEWLKKNRVRVTPFDFDLVKTHVIEQFICKGCESTNLFLVNPEDLPPNCPDNEQFVCEHEILTD